MPQNIRVSLEEYERLEREAKRQGFPSPDAYVDHVIMMHALAKRETLDKTIEKVLQREPWIAGSVDEFKHEAAIRYLEKLAVDGINLSED